MLTGKLESIQNIHELAEVAKSNLSEDGYAYLEGGADDGRTFHRNLSDLKQYYIRPRRLKDVSKIDTSLTLLGIGMNSPIIIAPIGYQMLFHDKGEIATALAASAQDHLMMVSTVSNHSYEDISIASIYKPWFQLYPTPNRELTRSLIQRVEKAGCRVLVLTVDTPVLGNREGHNTILEHLNAGRFPLPNFEGIRKDEAINDPSITWDFIEWLRRTTRMKIVLKGILTREDAFLAITNKVDGIVVSNHGGRQLESDLSTINALQEITTEINGRMPVLFDGGIRRGTDIFKALALGANAVCIGRPFIYGLAAFGQGGVEKCLEILQTELVRTMQLAGTPTLKKINKTYIGMH